METWWPLDLKTWIAMAAIGFGILFAIWASFVGLYLLPRGYGRRQVFVGIAATVVAAFACMVSGIVAIVDDQPPQIYVALLFLGSLFYCVPLSLVPTFEVCYNLDQTRIREGAKCNYPKWLIARFGWRGIVALPNDWRPHGRFGKWRKLVIVVHGAIGLIVLVWGLWNVLNGAQIFDDDEWMMIFLIGFIFSFSSFDAWFMFPGTSKTDEQKRLAAEELRRS